MRNDHSPASTGYKVLISTTSKLLGEYRGNKVSLALAFPDIESVDTQMAESPMSRSAAMVLFEWEHLKTPERNMPDFSAEGVGQCVSDVLSVLFGKRFDSHGPVEGIGIFQVPNLAAYSTPSRPGLPFNTHQERASFPVTLALSQAERVERWLFPKIDNVDTRRIQTACGFYSRALQNAERDAEVAYLHLITAGEVLTNLEAPAREELLDSEIQKDLEEIRTKVGERCANRIARRMMSIRKGFAKSLLLHLDSDFYTAGEADPTNRSYFKARGMAGLNKDFDMAKCLESAYDVRSKYVHSGAPFGTWVAPRHVSDRVLGRPVLADKGLAKTLEMCPTFCGLERVIRYVLLRRMGLSHRSGSKKTKSD